MAKQSLPDRQQSYKTVFGSDTAKDVLTDLSDFCRGSKTTFDKDARIHALLEGRREVFLRIMQHLELTEEEIFSLYR